MQLMVDLSSNNGAPNLRAHWDAGYRVLALKVSEGNRYVWSQHGPLADTWHRMGGVVWHYHFARPGQPESQARWFSNATRPHLKAGDRIVLDCEVGGVDGTFVRAFQKAVTVSAPGVIYGGPYFLRDNRITSGGWALWLAAYTPHVPFIPPSWKTWLAWQYTDRAHVPGISGGVDESRIATAALPVVKRVAAKVRALFPPTVKPGQSGPTVRRVQTLLNAKTKAGLVVDGRFGPKTAAAVNRIKASRRWKADGTVDRNVWNYLTH